MIEHITITQASEDDCRDLFEWRNDAHTRAMSLSAEPMSWASHLAWFGAALADPSRYLLIGSLGSAKVGVCRFDVSAASAASGARAKAVPVAEVGINLNPAMRGRRLSAALLAAGMREFARVHPVPLIARIKPANAASIRCFLRCGFALQGELGECRIYRHTGAAT